MTAGYDTTDTMVTLDIQEITDELSFDTWAFIGKVVNKTKVRTLTGRNGKYFYFEVIDTTSKIKCWVYNEEIPSFYKHLKINSFYKFQNVWVKKKIDLPSHVIHQHTCHIIFQNETIVHKLDELIKSLEAVEKVEPEAIIGPFIFGVMITIGEFQNLISAFDKRVLKVREIIIVDKSGTHIQINIWDEDSINFPGRVGDIIQIKNGVKFNDIISIYNFEINSKYQQTKLLQIWYEDYKHRSMYKGRCDKKDLCSCGSAFQLTPQFKGTLRSLSLEDIQRVRISVYRCLQKQYREFININNEKIKLYMEKFNLKVMSKITDEELDALLLVRGPNERLFELAEMIKSLKLSK